jgi:hypothetical protein
MAKIQIVEGKFDATCTTEKDLIENEIMYPEISDVIQYSEQRMVSTLICSGAKDPYQTAAGNDDVKTKIGEIPKDQLIGNSGYRYRVWGRIQKSSVINNQVGTSGSDGTFTLSMKDAYLVPGMNVFFHGQRFQARVSSAPTGSTGNHIYQFQSVDGTVFDWDLHVAGQQGEKTCFGGYTSYGEKSLRGYSRTHYPDMFINHTTIQRKSVSISGTANATVLWINKNGVSGWMFEELRQARVQFLLEDEHAKWWGKSSMKASDGTLLASPNLRDAETGQPITQGDGIFEQIEGVNVSYGSGINGDPTLDDIEDMMTVLKRKGNSITGNLWYVVTGANGMRILDRELKTEMNNVYNLTVNSDGSKQIGGPELPVGFTFKQYNYNGNQIIGVEHPMFDDDQRWSERGSDGELIMSSTLVFLDMSSQGGKKNIEILGRGAYGANRTMVSGKISGMTGSAMKKLGINTPVDADENHMLKEDGIFIYRTRTCGILYKSAN